MIKDLNRRELGLICSALYSRFLGEEEEAILYWKRSKEDGPSMKAMDIKNALRCAREATGCHNLLMKIDSNFPMPTYRVDKKFLEKKCSDKD